MNAFFSTNFLKKYFAFIGFPVLFRGLYLLDTLALQEQRFKINPILTIPFTQEKGALRSILSLAFKMGKRRLNWFPELMVF
ncbi:hypothetical protein BST99_13250 [Aureicoccus marinus]|uniref:Uncharacterized protein n=1 Tax=Aureicoccus marinus TaxID=754435 RepID=A0A2S7TAK0_9FLAO|nr:hypothetical protein BST99_13250 [Aureicoccus marinus]